MIESRSPQGQAREPSNGPLARATLSQSPERKRIKLAVGLALLWTCFILLGEFSGALPLFEEPFLDWEQTLSTWETASNDQLALVAIDTIPPERPWPWPRLDYTLMLRSVIDYAPNSIVFEMTLNDRDTQYDAFDSTFSHVINRANVVVFSGKLLSAESSDPPPHNMTPLHVAGDPRRVPHFNSAFWPLDTFAGSSPVGVNNLELEDHYFRLRRVPLVFTLKQISLPSLTLQATAQYLGADLSKSEVQLGHAIYLRRSDGQLLRTIPIDEAGQMRIRFHDNSPASWVASFDNIVVYAQQLRNHLQSEMDLHDLRKRQIWVGRTDRDAPEHFKTPLGFLTRVQVQMQAERTILNQDYVRPLPSFLLVIVYFFIAAGGATATLHLGPKHTFVLLLILFSFWVESTLFCFRLYNLTLPLISFAFLLAGTYGVGLLVYFLDLEDKSA